MRPKLEFAPTSSRSPLGGDKSCVCSGRAQKLGRVRNNGGTEQSNQVTIESTVVDPKSGRTWVARAAMTARASLQTVGAE